MIYEYRFTDTITIWNIILRKSVRIWSYSGLHYPAFGLNAEQNNSEYGDVLRSESCFF